MWLTTKIRNTWYFFHLFSLLMSFNSSTVTCIMDVVCPSPELCTSLSRVCYPVEPVLKEHSIGHKNVVCQDRWCLIMLMTGSVLLKYRSFCQKCVVCQDRWSLMPVVSQDRFHCIPSHVLRHMKSVQQLTHILVHIS